MSTFKNFAEIKDYLESLGYELEFYDYIDSDLVSVDFLHDETKRTISVYTEYTEEFDNYLATLEQGSEVEWQDTDVLVEAISVEVKGIHYPDDFENQIKFPNDKEMLDYVLSIINNLNEHAKRLYIKHFENIEKWKEEHKDFLEKYDLVQCYDSILDCSEKGDSCPLVAFCMKREAKAYMPVTEILVWTDFLTMEVKDSINDNSIDILNRKLEFYKTEG